MSAEGQPAAPAAAPQVSPIDAAIAKLKAEDPTVRRQGAEECARLRDPKAGPTLLGAITDKNPAVRAGVIDALGTIRTGGPQIAERLVKDEDPQVRSQAAIALTYIGDPSTEDALLKALEDSAQSVRFSAMRTLGNMRSQKAVPKLIAMLSSPDVPSRQAAAAALERVSSHDAFEALKTATADSDPTVRQQAVRALAAIGDKAAVDTLKERLKDSVPQVQVQAAMALGRFNDPSGLPTGLALLQAPEPLLRQQGSQIVGVVGDEPIGLKALNAAFEKELDPGTRQMIDLARSQLKARLGLKEEPPAPTPSVAPAAPKPAAKPAAKPETGKKKAPAAKKKPAAPKKP